MTETAMPRTAARFVGQSVARKEDARLLAGHGEYADNVVHAAWGLQSNAMVAMPFMPLSGDLDDAFANAAHVVECTIEQNRYICVPMETRGIVASWTPGRDELDIACATQSVHETRNF